jgi:hypothetical protein
MKEDMGSRRKRGFKPKEKKDGPMHEMSEKASGYMESMPMMAAKKSKGRRKGKSARGC